jgi:hypothetical protein
MSLWPVSAYAVPEQTSKVARAAFPGGSLCMRIYDELGTIFQDQDFADCSHRRTLYVKRKGIRWKSNCRMQFKAYKLTTLMLIK